MRRFMHRLLFLLFLTVTVPAIGAPHYDESFTGTEDSPDEGWDEFLRNLFVLTQGTPEDKHALIDDTGLFGIFLPLDEPPEKQAGDWVIATIRDWIGYEEDAWILHLAMDDLVDSHLEDVELVFRDLSGHPIPSLRSHAIEWAEWMDDEEAAARWLEEMWAQEQVPWLLARLLDVLEDFDVTVHIEACAELIGSPDLELATAAMDCGAWNGLPEAGPALMYQILQGRAPYRRAALRAFIRWWGSAADDDARVPLVEALERMWKGGVPTWMEVDLLHAVHATGSKMALAAARDVLFERAELAQAAISILAGQSSPDVTELLIDRASHGATSLRIAAMGALDPPSWVPPMGTLLDSSLRPGQPQAVRLAAMKALLRWNRSTRRGGALSDESRPYKEVLQEMAASEGDLVIRGEAAVTLELWESGVQFVTTSCGFTPPVRHVLRAREPAASVRCWKAPWQERTPAVAHRFSSEGSFVEQDRFDDGQVLWRYFVTTEGACWVPQDRTRIIMPEEEESLLETYRTYLEFDLPMQRVRSESFRHLERLHLLSTFDEGETLVGVRLHLDATDEAFEALRSAAVQWSGTLLGEAVRSVLKEMADRPEGLRGWEAWLEP